MFKPVNCLGLQGLCLGGWCSCLGVWDLCLGDSDLTVCALEFRVEGYAFEFNLGVRGFLALGFGALGVKMSKEDRT